MKQLFFTAFFSVLLSGVFAQIPADLFSNPDPSRLRKVDSIYHTMTFAERIGQMVFVASGTLGRSEAELKLLVEEKKVGGIIFLGGTSDDFKVTVKTLNEQALTGIPLLYSLDAEPSLIRYKLKEVGTFVKTNALKTPDEVDSAVTIIDQMLANVGVTVNYAPVCDLTPSNEVIGHRSFGKSEDSVVLLSKAFIDKSLKDGVLPVIKHFPGHGNVEGDSHKKLVYINGPFKELNVFKRMIDLGAPSVMVGHIAVKNNKYASEEAATCSPLIVSSLLRDSLGFQGLVITDALNMGAVSAMENPGLKAMVAGCDVILMPKDVNLLHETALKKLKEDDIFALQLEASVKRILLLKVYQGLL